MIIIFFLQSTFDAIGELFAGFSFRRDQADVRHLQLAAVVYAQALRVVIPIFHDAEADIIVAAELLFVIEHLHRVGAHHRI